MKLENFKRLGVKVCNEYKVKKASFLIGEPYKGEKLYLRFSQETRDFTIEHEDGQKLSDKLTKKLLPNALTIMYSTIKGIDQAEALKKKGLQKVNGLTTTVSGIIV